MDGYMIGPNAEGAYSPAFAASRQKLVRLTPRQISENTSCQFDQEKGSFVLESFGTLFEICYPDGEVQFFGQQGIRPIIAWRLLLLNHLSEAKNIPITGKWISYKDQPHGSVFYPSIRLNVIEKMARFYDSCDKEVLRTAIVQLGFEIEKGKADITARALFLPRVPVLVQFWDGDDEISGSFQILFDSSIATQMHIEDSAGLCELIKFLIIKQYKLVANNTKNKVE